MGPLAWPLAQSMKRKYRRGSERKGFLGVLGDLNSGLRIETDTISNAPAEPITYSKEGGVVPDRRLVKSAVS